MSGTGSSLDVEHHVDLSTGEALDRRVSAATAELLHQVRVDAAAAERARERVRQALERLRAFTRTTGPASQQIADLLTVLGLEETHE